MQNILDRIVSAAPDPVRLDDNEFAKLSAYLAANRRQRVDVSELLSAAKGDPAAMEKRERRKASWAAWRGTLEYNREMRNAIEQAATKAASAKPGRKMTGKHVKDKPLTAKQKEAYDTLSACGGNRTEAAQRLGITRAALGDRLQGMALRGGLGHNRSASARRQIPADSRGQAQVKRK